MWSKDYDFEKGGNPIREINDTQDLFRKKVKENAKYYYNTDVLKSEQAKAGFIEGKDSSVVVNIKRRFEDGLEESLIEPQDKGIFNNRILGNAYKNIAKLLDLDSTPLTEEEWKKSEHYSEGMSLKEGEQMTLGKAKRYAQRKKEREFAKEVADASDSFIGATIRYGTQFGTNLVADLPFLAPQGAATKAALSTFGIKGTQTLLQKMGIGAIENMVFTGIADHTFIDPQKVREGEQAKTSEEKAFDYLISGGIGAAFPMLGAGVKKLFKKSSKPDINLEKPETDIKVSNTADETKDLLKIKAEAEAVRNLDTKTLENIKQDGFYNKNNEYINDDGFKSALKTEEFSQSLNKKLDFEYDVVDLEDLRMSFKDGKPQNYKLENKLPQDYAEYLGFATDGDAYSKKRFLTSNNFEDGAPLINENNLVINGNKKLNSIDNFYKVSDEGYKSDLLKSFPQFENKINKMAKPTLVKVLKTDLEEAELKTLRSEMNVKKDFKEETASINKKTNTETEAIEILADKERVLRISKEDEAYVNSIKESEVREKFRSEMQAEASALAKIKEVIDCMKS